jgi:hypothetical protein
VQVGGSNHGVTSDGWRAGRRRTTGLNKGRLKKSVYGRSERFITTQESLPVSESSLRR